MTYKIDVNIVDDHKMLADGLASAINESNVAHVSHSFNTLEACRKKIAERHPDVLLLDISMPDGNSMDFCRQILQRYPSIKVIVLTSHDEYSIIKEMTEMGVHGYVLKSSPIEELLEAIKTVYHGKKLISHEVKNILEGKEGQHIFLTPNERKCLQLICDGLTNPQIAEKLFISIDTANWYRKRLLVKFNVKNSVSLVTTAIKEHLVPLPTENHH